MGPEKRKATRLKLPEKAIDIIETWRLGFVATVASDGTPNVSPKGTFVVLNDTNIAFGEIASPNTIANIKHQPQVEVNFVDILSRRGLRVRGDASVINRGQDWFVRLMPNFEGLWDEALLAKFNAIVMIEISTFSQLKSPSYALGTTEQEFRTKWQEKIAAMPQTLDR